MLCCEAEWKQNRRPFLLLLLSLLLLLHHRTRVIRTGTLLSFSSRLCANACKAMWSAVSGTVRLFKLLRAYPAELLQNWCCRYRVRVC